MALADDSTFNQFYWLGETRKNVWLNGLTVDFAVANGSSVPERKFNDDDMAHQYQFPDWSLRRLIHLEVTNSNSAYC